MEETVLMNPEEQQIVSGVRELANKVNKVIIHTQEDYLSAVEFVREIKTRTATVKSFFKPLKDAAHLAHKQICDRENEVVKPLDFAEKTLKGKMSEWTAEQERIRQEKEEEARKQAKEEADRLFAQAGEAEANNDAISAEMLLQTATMVDDAASNIVVESAAKKVDGVSYVTDYEIVVKDTTKVPTDINGVCIRPVDVAAIKKLVKLTKGNVKIDGIEIREVKNVRVGR